MRVAQVLHLAQVYATARGGSLRTVGLKAAGNNLLFVRLAQGHGCNVFTIERAADWLVANWPDDLPWPEDVPRPDVVPRGASDPPPPAKAKSRGMVAA